MTFQRSPITHHPRHAARAGGRWFGAAAAALALAMAAGAAQTSGIDAGQLLKDLETLAADGMEGRQVGTPGGARARAYLVERFKEAGVQPFGATYEHPFAVKPPRDAADRTGVNVLGFIAGRRDPARFLVITAHYDHLGVRNGQVFNGADDNASGVAALLAVAKALSIAPPEHSVLFAALDAEEVGLVGARELLRQPPVPASSMILNVNLDMVARDADNKLYAAGPYHYPYLKPFLAAVAVAPARLLFGHDTPNAKEDDWTGDSDHFPFHQAGIPFIYFGVEDEAQHHKPTDDAATVTKEFFVAATHTILNAVRILDANLDAIAKARAQPPR